MTTTESTPSPPPPAPERKKRRGLWWKILLGIIVVILLLTLLAPTVMSTGAGKNFILGKVNAKIAGTVEAESISIGWFSGASVRGLIVKDPEGKEVLNIPSVDTGLTLWSAVRSSFDSLNLVLRGKSATITSNADGTTNLGRAFASRAGAGEAAMPAAMAPAQPAAPSSASSPSSPTVHANIDAQFESIVCTSPNAAPVTIQDVVAKGVVDTGGGATDLKISAQAKSGNGNPAAITAAMNGNFFDHGNVKPLGEITGTAKSHVQALDLAALTPILNASGLKVQLTGVSALDFNLGQTNGNQTATAKVTINQLVATGEMLKGDTFKRNLVTVTLDAALKGDNVDVHGLNLATDAISAQIAGSMKTSASAGGPLPPLTINSVVDVTALKQDLPHLLGDVPDTQATVALSGSMDSEKKLFTVTADSSIAEKDPKTGTGNSIVLAKGSVLSWGDGANDIHGAASINWPRLQGILGKRLPEGTTLQGARTINLHVAGAMTKATGLGAFKGFTIDPTSIGWDQIASEGLTLGKADVGIQMKSGVLTISPTDVPANGGIMHLAGRVDFNQEPPAFILDKQPQGTQLIKGLQLNKEIAAGPLAFLPLSWGGDKNSPSLGNIAGQANVNLLQAFVPLDSVAFAQKGTANGTLNISNLSTDAPFFSQLLSALGPLAKITQPDLLTIRGGNIPDTPFGLVNGKVSYQNLTLGSSKLSLQFSGSVGLDKSLAMTVDVTASSVHIPIPIGLAGTTAQPKLAIAPGSGGKQDLGNTIQDVAGGLDKLLNNKKKK